MARRKSKSEREAENFLINMFSWSVALVITIIVEGSQIIFSIIKSIVRFFQNKEKDRLERNKSHSSIKKKIAERWNDFSAFREEHYIRDIEQKLQDDGIFDEVLNLVNDSTLLNSSMYNSKNYKKEGSYQDYVNYIYDKIDGKNDQL